MSNVLKLSKPLKVSNHDGIKEITELEYDFENMTARDKMNAGKQLKAEGNCIMSEELDPDYHLYLFAVAVCKVNPDMTTADVLNMNAKDAQKASSLARDFFYFSSEE